MIEEAVEKAALEEIQKEGESDVLEESYDLVAQ